MSKRSRQKRQSIGDAFGGAMVGFDYQIFRATPPPPELVEEGKPIAPVPAEDGGLLSIVLPDGPGLDEGDAGA